MLAELESNQLLVELVPERRRTHEMGMIRVVCGRNANWYRHFCSRHPSSRGTRRGKFDTRIRRANVVRLLNVLITGEPTKSKYAAEILRLATA